MIWSHPGPEATEPQVMMPLSPHLHPQGDVMSGDVLPVHATVHQEQRCSVALVTEDFVQNYRTKLP